MKKVLLAIFIAFGVVLIASASRPTKASPPNQFDDPVKQGEYIANIVRCVWCHTPLLPEYSPANTEMTEDQIRVSALTPRETLDESKWLAGGQRFGSEEAGFIYSANLTPDDETGIGTWTLEQFHTALRTGVNPDGRRLSSMPSYGTMADSDIDALYAYFQSLEPIANEITKDVISEAPPGSMPAEPLIAPSPSNQTERGNYLVLMMGCSGCHTPSDPDTRQPIMEKFLAGRQPFERAYGTVYAGNITPHEETGIGKWTTAEIKRAINSGVRIDGRRLAFMPWQDYSRLTPEDLDAIVFFLQNDLDAVDNPLPATALLEEYQEFVDVGQADSDSDDDEENDESIVPTLIIGGIIGLVVALGLGAYKRSKAKKS